MMKINTQQRGFTLLELVVTIAIVGILLALAAPQFSTALARNAGREVVTNWQESFYFAQAEAIRLQSDVLICASNDGTRCNGASFADGWIICEESSGDCNSGSGRVLRDVPPPNVAGLEIDSSNNNTQYTFNGAGRLRGFIGDTITFTLARNNTNAYERALRLNTEGRIR